MFDIFWIFWILTVKKNSPLFDKVGDLRSAIVLTSQSGKTLSFFIKHLRETASEVYVYMWTSDIYLDATIFDLQLPPFRWNYQFLTS